MSGFAFPVAFVRNVIRRVCDYGCPVCGAETGDGRLCKACRSALEIARLAYPEFRLTESALPGQAVGCERAVVCRTLYTYEYDAVRGLLFYLKRHPDKASVKECAMKLIGILPENLKSGKVLYINIPRSSTGLRKYGFDQAALLAGTLVKLLNDSAAPQDGKRGVPFKTKTALSAEKVYFSGCLARLPFGKEQKGLNAGQRVANQSGRYYVRPFFRRPPWNPQRIVLVDDVITTGASVLSAAKTLSEQYPDAEITALSLATVCGSDMKKQK